MSDDIQFGEVEELRPETQRRPDQNRHWAIAAYDAPAAYDLPIFIDIDVLDDMEQHALSDDSVELGGVMLGGQYEDEDGNPFVVVLDSLRAKHYESSQGHFKFTHDTWSEISRQREEFAEDLQMVGWYHTHPNWGVFLSGMDRFICDNFFNRPLDVAFVIDPVRGDRGWFYWSDAEEPLPRVKGFYVIASRFRQDELDNYVACLKEDGTMTPPRGSGRAQRDFDAPITQQVIHTIQPQMGWMGIAIVAILVLQFCATLLLAWRLGAPAASNQREELLNAREEVFEQLVGQVKVTDEGQLNINDIVSDNLELKEEVERLKRADLLVDELGIRFDQLSEESNVLKQDVLQLESKKQESLEETEELKTEIKELNSEHEKTNEKAQEKIDKLEEGLEEATGSPDGGGRIGMWGGIFIGAIAIVLLWLLSMFMKSKRTETAVEED